MLGPLAFGPPLSDWPLAVVNGRLVTTRAAAEDALLLELPREWVMSKDSAQDTSLLRYLDPFDEPPPRGLPHWSALPDDFVLALQLALLQRDAGAATRGEERTSAGWSAAWLEMARVQLNGTPHWTADERELLEGSQVLRREAEQLRRVASHQVPSAARRRASPLCPRCQLTLRPSAPVPHGSRICSRLLRRTILHSSTLMRLVASRPLR